MGVSVANESLGFRVALFISEIRPNHPINQTLNNILDEELRSNRYLNTSDLSSEEAQKLISEFPKNKYYFGPVMIAHGDIVKVEMQRKVLETPAEPMPLKHSRREKQKE